MYTILAYPSHFIFTNHTNNQALGALLQARGSSTLAPKYLDPADKAITVIIGQNCRYMYTYRVGYTRHFSREIAIEYS